MLDEAVGLIAAAARRNASGGGDSDKGISIRQDKSLTHDPEEVRQEERQGRRLLRRGGGRAEEQEQHGPVRLLLLLLLLPLLLSGSPGEVEGRRRKEWHRGKVSLSGEDLVQGASLGGGKQVVQVNSPTYYDCPNGKLMFFLSIRRHHLDPISLIHQTLEMREHMYGDTDVVIVVKGERFPAHK